MLLCSLAQKPAAPSVPPLPSIYRPRTSTQHLLLRHAQPHSTVPPTLPCSAVVASHSQSRGNEGPPNSSGSRSGPAVAPATAVAALKSTAAAAEPAAAPATTAVAALPATAAAAVASNAAAGQDSWPRKSPHMANVTLLHRLDKAHLHKPKAHDAFAKKSAPGAKGTVHACLCMQP